MTFLAPLFLAASLAAAIPVILHMINRQRRQGTALQHAPFPANQRAEDPQPAERIQDSFLMLVRATLLTLLALGLARPTMTSLSRS